MKRNTFTVPYDTQDPALGSIGRAAQAYKELYDTNYGKTPLSYRIWGMGDDYSAAVQTAWRKRMDMLPEMQKNLDAVSQPRKDTMGTQALFDEAKRLGMIPSTAPDLYRRDLPGMDGTPAKQHDIPNYSKEFLDSTRKGYFAGSDINTMMDLQDYQTSQNYNLPSQKLGTYIGNQSGVTTNPDGTTTLSGNASQTVDARPQRPNIPFFVSDPQTMMTQVTSASNNALAEGQKRYQFDQEAPNRSASIQKDLEQARFYHRQGDTEAYQAKIAEIEAKYRGPLRQSEINRNNRPPVGGGGGQPNHDAVMMQLYGADGLKKAGYGLPEGPSLNETYQRAALEDQAAQKDWFGNPTPEARRAQMVLDRVGSGVAGAGSAPAANVAPRPTLSPAGSAYLQKIRGKAPGG